jgi:predicted amidohydrolase
MKVAAVQMSGVPGNLGANLDAIAAHARAGAEAGCRLLLFPEISDLGYDMPSIGRLGTDSWPVVRQRLLDLAAECGLCLVCGVCLPGDDGLFNALVAFGPGGAILARYRKVHLFKGQDADETRVFVPGRKLVTFDLDGVRFGLAVCYDLRFPELFRALAVSGCHALLLASAWPRARIGVWQPMCVARAVENQCYLLGADRVGDQGAFPFGGRSLFVTPTGEVTAADGSEERLVQGDVDPQAVVSIRRAMPTLHHLRPDVYAEVPDNSTEIL